MLDFFKRFFNPEPSSVTARERLRLVLLSDHLALAPDVVESLKTDLIAVISKYVDVDTANCDVTFEQQDRQVAMLANIPILGMKPAEKKPPSSPAPPAPSVVAVAPPEPPSFSDSAPSPAAVIDAPDVDPTVLEAVVALVDAPVAERRASSSKPRRRRRRRAAVSTAPAAG
jgi:cell division topological specificity factor